MTPHRSTAKDDPISETKNEITPHPWGILFTILGTVLLDFDADACQSPARAYLLDVTIPGKINSFLIKTANNVHWYQKNQFFLKKLKFFR